MKEKDPRVAARNRDNQEGDDPTQARARALTHGRLRRDGAKVRDRARDMPHRGIAIAARISIDVTQRNGRDELQK